MGSKIQTENRARYVKRLAVFTGIPGLCSIQGRSGRPADVAKPGSLVSKPYILFFYYFDVGRVVEGFQRRIGFQGYRGMERAYGNGAITGIHEGSGAGKRAAV